MMTIAPKDCVDVFCRRWSATFLWVGIFLKLRRRCRSGTPSALPLKTTRS